VYVCVCVRVCTRVCLRVHLYCCVGAVGEDVWPKPFFMRHCECATVTVAKPAFKQTIISASFTAHVTEHKRHQEQEIFTNHSTCPAFFIIQL